MKVSTVQRDISLKQGSLMPQKKSSEFREKSTGANKDENRGYSANYGGSFTGKSETAANAMKKGGILASGWFNKLLACSNDHNIATSAFVALGLAGVCRPFAILALPGKKDKEDKIYAAGQAVASAIIGFVASVLVTSPLDGAIKKLFANGDGTLKDKDGNIIKDSDGKPKIFSKKLSELLKKEKELEKRANARDAMGKIIDRAARTEYKAIQRHRAALDTLAKNIPDFVIAVPRSIVTIALIPPILKYLFGVEKKKKTEQTTMNNNPAQNSSLSMDFVNKEVFNKFKGGVQ